MIESYTFKHLLSFKNITNLNVSEL